MRVITSGCLNELYAKGVEWRSSDNSSSIVLWELPGKLISPQMISLLTASIPRDVNEATNPRGRGHNPRGRGHKPRGRGHNPRGRGHNPRGRGHNPRGRGHNPRGRGHNPRGRGHNPRGRGQDPSRDSCYYYLTNIN